MKKRFILVLTGAMVLSMAACTSITADTAPTEPAVTEAAPTEAPDDTAVNTPETTPEDSQPEEVVDDVIDKPDFTGTYTEPMYGRCTIDIDY